VQTFRKHRAGLSAIAGLSCLLRDDCLSGWFVQKKDTGQTLLDKVFKHLELHEKDYFGLQFASVVSTISDAVVSST